MSIRFFGRGLAVRTLQGYIRDVPQTSRLKLILLASSLFLGACSSGTEHDVIMSRWLKRDTTLAYTVHVYKWKGERRLATEPRTSEIKWSRLELYTVDILWDAGTPSFTEPRALRTLSHAVPCPDLLFKDSLLIFSYLERDKGKPRACYEEGEAPGAPNPGRRLMAGIPDDSAYAEVSGNPDSGALLTELTTEQARTNDVPVLSDHGRLCLNGDPPCVYPFD